MRHISAKDTNFDVSRSTIFLSYITQFLNYGIAIFVLPLILVKFESDELAIWYLFLSITSLVSLIDFGFSVSIERNVSFIFGGANELIKEGCSLNVTKEGINYYLLKSLLNSATKIYRYIGLSILVLLLVFGTLYLKKVLSDKFTPQIIYLWIIYATSIAFNFYYNYFLVVLKGRGLIQHNNYIIIVSKLLYLATLYILLINNYGLVALVMANIVSSLSVRILGKIYYLDQNTKRRINEIKQSSNIFPVIWYNAKKFGMSRLGVFLVSQSGIFICGLYFSLQDVAEIGLLLQIFSITQVLARVYFTAHIPKISSLWVKNDKVGIKNIFLRSQIIGYLFYFIIISVLLWKGNYILNEIIKSKTVLPSNIIIILYCFFYFMEITHGNSASLLATENKVPFLKASLISGAASVILTIIFIYNGFGLISLPLGLIAAQLPYNSWKWPYEVYKKLRVYQNVNC